MGKLARRGCALLRGEHARPLVILALTILLLTALDAGQGRFLSRATAFTALETFGDTGLVQAGATVIAAGGFVMNPDMVARYTPVLGGKLITLG